MTGFSKALSQGKEFENFIKEYTNAGAPCGATGLSDVSKILLIHSMCQSLGKKALVIVPDEIVASHYLEDFLLLDNKVHLFPSREFTFVDVHGVSRDFEHKRLDIMSRMASGNFQTIIASIGAATQVTMPPDDMKKKAFEIKQGEDIDLSDVSQKLIDAGYTKYDQVDGTSQFSIRGSLIDVFPPGAESPYRIELWGDTVDSIAYFDVATQRRGKTVSKINIIPSSEVLFESSEKQAKKIDEFATNLKGKAVKCRDRLYEDSNRLRQGLKLRCQDKYLPLAYDKSYGLFDYVNDDTLVFICETGKVKERNETYEKLLISELKKLVSDGVLCKGLDRFRVNNDELFEIYEKTNAIYLDSLPRGSFDTPIRALGTFKAQTINPWAGSVNQLSEEIHPLIENNYAVVIAAGSESHAKYLSEGLEELGFNALAYNKIPDEFLHAAVSVIPGSLSSGFQISESKLVVYTYKTSSNSKKKKRKKLENPLKSLDEIKPGDYVVHYVHGIGVYKGIYAREIDGITRDYLKIEYAGGDTLSIPVTALDLVSKYIGNTDTTRIKINSLDSKGVTKWKKTKAKVQSAVEELAGELIQLYAKRLSTPGYAFGPDTDMQDEFESEFEFVETADQIQCTEEIKSDMEKSFPMDRLLCGDVGFGKTEVALRACFKCICDGKQAAILVPTTVLAKQHYETALRRMSSFPIKIETISRFVSSAKQTEIKKKLKTGEIDLLIGTHKMISKGIEFGNLGLLIVDEEQRFGVFQKEKIKEKFPNVDVLTLSATPIPRTLNMAMSGIRDMSVIEEAPGDRMPVQTYVLQYDFDIIVEALQKEYMRGGQSYYLHNNTSTIRAVATRIKQAMPDAVVGIAHGQMGREELNEVWEQLVDGQIDILVCTTIIETGIDVANVNTLIVEGADRMGLSQLHQIRGRVGRSTRRAYAYFTCNDPSSLSEESLERLEAIRDYTEFGSGFKIAMRDLEIRGAGSLLGTQQHGHMDAVGYDLYMSLLEEAVDKQKGIVKEVDKEDECSVDLPVDASIPEKYIPSTNQRISIYKRVASIKDETEAQDLFDEITDRFGSPPEPVYGLVRIAIVRKLATSLGIYRICKIANKIHLYFFEDKVIPPYLLILNNHFGKRGEYVKTGKTYMAIRIGEGFDAGPLETVENLLSMFDSAKKDFEQYANNN